MRRRRSGPAVVGWALGLALAVPSAPLPGQVLDNYRLDAPPALRVSLPSRLAEVSGLALTPDGRLLAHGDERATISEVDPRLGTIVKSFSLGDKPVRGDFEGIALVGARLILVTSDGQLYESKEGADGARLPFSLTETGLGRRCEIEGVGYEPSDGMLLLACKDPRAEELRGFLTIFRWSLERRTLAPTPLQFRLKDVVRKTGTAHFHPSDIVREPTSGHYLLLSGRDEAIVEVTAAGEMVAGRHFPAGQHQQAEGIAFLPDGTLLISDESVRGPATLSWYSHVR